MAVSIVGRRISVLDTKTDPDGSSLFVFAHSSANYKISKTQLDAVVAPTFTNVSGKPTTLSGYGITDAQPSNSRLTVISTLGSANQQLRVNSGGTEIEYFTPSSEITFSATGASADYKIPFTGLTLNTSGDSSLSISSSDGFTFNPGTEYLSVGGAQLTKTTNQIVLGITNTLTINSPAPASSRTYVIPNDKADGDEFAFISDIPSVSISANQVAYGNSGGTGITSSNEFSIASATDSYVLSIGDNGTRAGAITLGGKNGFVGSHVTLKDDTDASYSLRLFQNAGANKTAFGSGLGGDMLLSRTYTSSNKNLAIVSRVNNSAVSQSAIELVSYVNTSNAALTSRPTLAGYNYTTKQWEVGADGTWDFRDNVLGDVGAILVSGIGVVGGTFTAASASHIFQQVDDAIYIPGNSGNAPTTPFYYMDGDGDAVVIGAGNAADTISTIPKMQFAVFDTSPVDEVDNRPLFGWYNYQTLLVDVSSGGTWNFQNNQIIGLSQLNVSNLQITGNTISTIANNLILVPSDSVHINKTSNQIVTGAGSNLTTINFPASSGAVTITMPNVTSTVLYSGGALGTPSSGTVTNLTGTASININGTVGATTPSTGVFTTLSATTQALIGLTTARTNTMSANYLTQIEGTSGTTGISVVRNGGIAELVLSRTGGSSVGDNTTIVNGNAVGNIKFGGADGTNIVELVRINAYADGTISTGVIPGGFLFRVANSSGTLTEAFRITSTSAVKFANIGTTASAANAFLDSGDSNNLLRSTSSRIYKTDIETIETTYVDNFIDNARPVWYRSLAKNDNKGWGWYGLIAEEVAEIDPRLVHWAKRIITPEERDEETGDLINEAVYSELMPDGVQYERISVLLLAEVKRLRDEVNMLKNALE